MELSPVTEEYLKTVYQLERDLSRRVRTTEIAETTGRTQPSVSHMVQKLDDEGLVDYTKYNGVRVTESGTAAALSVLRKHRLVETFIAEQLGAPWPEVHEEADRLEHHISGEFTDRLAAFLGNPQTDPHGDPIPDADLQLPDEQSRMELTDCRPGETLAVETVPDHDPDVQQYLFENNIDPGSTIVVDTVSPVGLLTVSIDTTGRSVAIPDHIARRITVAQQAETVDGTNN